ncbi:MAG: HEPN domain-containing protein [Candidatus Caldarchaeum sp.]|nr:HEPN domain-containing protein [Candidatus Caldarchaeum sp.]
MSFAEAEIIRRRAEAFLNNAEQLLKQSEWDLAVFSLEQYCQLIMKYKLLFKAGHYIRTPSLRRLVKELMKHHPGLETLIQDEQNLHYLARLEEACVTARYMPYVYEEKEAVSLYRFVREKFKPLVEEIK